MRSRNEMPRPLSRAFLNFYRFYSTPQTSSTTKQTPPAPKWVPERFEIDGQTYIPDEKFWNLTPKMISLTQRRLLSEEGNPLNLLKRKIVNHMHKKHRKPGNRSPIYAVCEDQKRVVTVFENFDSLLTPIDHVSRQLSDTYYVNRDFCLRAHTSAHQYSLIKQGFDNFLVVGDVYRRDEIDRNHFPCFHQMEGVRLYSADELFGTPEPTIDFKLFENGERTKEKQESHTYDAAKVLDLKLKETVESLCRELFGENAQMRWVDAYFPFTHPSYELEVFFNEKWLEVLGCGIMEQRLLESAGAGSKVGWAFGLGLERLAMILYGIPDIRLFWSKDPGFLYQFQGKQPDDKIQYVPLCLTYPHVSMDISFWLPENCDSAHMKSDSYDLIRNIGGDIIEQVLIIDEFHNPKKNLTSHCYRIIYRSNERVLTKDEVNVVHGKITEEFIRQYNVKIR